MFEPDVLYRDFGIEFLGTGYLVFVDGDEIYFPTIAEAKRFIDEKQRELDNVAN